MKLKSFVAKCAVVAIIASPVFFGSHYLYNDNENAEMNIVRMFNREAVAKPFSADNVATGWSLAGDSCFKNDIADIYPDYDTKEECEKAARNYDEMVKPYISNGLLYGRTMLASGALMFLALAAAFISVAFVGLSKLWKVK